MEKCKTGLEYLVALFQNKDGGTQSRGDTAGGHGSQPEGALSGQIQEDVDIDTIKARIITHAIK